MTYKKTLKVASFMATITIISKILGLFREIFLASIYGASFELTSFLAASKIPLTLFDITLGSVVSSVFIPIYTKISNEQNSKQANLFALSYTNLVLIITSITSILGIIFAKPIIAFSLSGADPQIIELSTNLLKIMFPMIIFTGLTYTFVGLLNCNQEFYITAILSLISNLFIIIFLCFSNNIYGLAIIMLLSWALQLIIELPWVYKFGFRYKFKLFDPNIKSALHLGLPILISSWAYPVSSLVNMKMASYLDSSSAVTYMELATRLYIVISGIFAYVISNLSYPYLAKFAYNDLRFGNLIKIILKSITFIIVPIMIGLIVLAVPIVRLAYERGNFTNYDSVETGHALIGLSFAMLAFSYNEALNKIFYAQHKAKIPMISGIIGTCITILTCFVLPDYFGIMGLGLSVTIGAMITFLINFYQLRHIWTASKFEYFEFCKISLAGILMGITVYKIESMLVGNFQKVFWPTIIGATEYFILAFIFKIDILHELISVFRKGPKYD
ncbi:MAG: murein biosynthesis integral membrane protein MurJ [Candidatus Epulonipiscioides saccharophilum]|nr:MAG: murein biosynthesis integral membrane protein MurJ [Epulopiscium sp. AS2M-Bin001]